FLQAQHGERIVLEDDKNCMIYRPGGAGAPTKDVLPLSQIINLVTEILPDEHRSAFASAQPLLFPYSFGSGEVDVEVSQSDGHIRVSIGIPESRDQSRAAPAAVREPPQAAPSGSGRRVEHIDELFRLLREMEGSDLHLCFLSKGLVVVTGPTGSGKSTTLAALVDHINKQRDDHIITIEDPIEFVHENIHCLVNQREVHVHTNSFSRALRAALREDPD